MYHFFFILGLINCLDFRQRNGFLSQLRVKTSELKDSSNLSISITDFNRIGTFDKTKVRYTKNGFVKCILGSTDTTATQMIFNNFSDDFLMKFEYTKSGKLISRQIAVKRIDNTTSFRICSPEEHLALLIEKFVELIMRIEERKHCYDNLLEKISKKYKQKQIIWCVISKMYNRYRKLIGNNLFTQTSLARSSRSIHLDRRDFIINYLKDCAQSVRDQCLQHKYIMFQNRNFPNFVFKSASARMTCAIFSQIYNSLAQEISEELRFAFLDFSNVKFSLKCSKCVVLEQRGTVVDNETNHVNDSKSIKKTANNYCLHDENTTLALKDQVKRYSCIDILGKPLNMNTFSKILSHFSFDQDIYLNYVDLIRKDIEAIRINYKHRDNHKKYYLDLKIN